MNLDPDRRRPDDLVPAIDCLTSAIQALTAQLSGSVEPNAPRPTAPDPDPKSPPTPLPGDHSRGGVGGSNHSKPGAGLLPGAAPPGPVPPGPGGTQDSRPGDNRGRAPGRELTLDEIEQLAYEERQAGER